MYNYTIKQVEITTIVIYLTTALTTASFRDRGVALKRAAASVPQPRYSENKFFRDIIVYAFNRYAFLLHRIAVTHRDTAVLPAFKVIGYAYRRAYFVLTAVSLAYRARVVEIRGEGSQELFIYRGSFRGQLLAERQHRAFKRREIRVEPLIPCAHRFAPRREPPRRRRQPGKRARRGQRLMMAR